ncbi:MAG: glycosyltransferase family 1 protein [Solirubrobacterales bacterium]|nr:glycosyltransferase family 1 protein [Solirubrobacterales bacterium]
MGRVVLATMGSWGDIFPAIGLAKGLIEAGHDARIAASPAYDELVRGEGLDFSGIGPPLGFSDYAQDPKILSGRLGGFAGFAYLFRRFIFPVLDRYVDDLAMSIRDADLLLAHPALVAAPVAAEHVGVEWGTVSVFPGLIPTACSPPSPPRVSLGSGRTRQMMYRAAWSAARFNMARLFDGHVNRERRRLGLPAVSNAFFAPVESGRPYLVMASPAVVDRPADWPATVALTGFIAWDRVSSFPDPPGLAEFLSAGEPPVLVTLGASSSLDPQHFYRHAAEAITHLGQRAVILTGPTPKQVDLPDDPGIFGTAFAPLSLVAPRCCAAVHHGGVGTTIGLLSSGLPQLVIPRGFDQPQTALRMTRLGVARALPWRRESTERITRELSALLSQDRYRRNAAALQARLAEENGLHESVRLVDLMMRA